MTMNSMLMWSVADCWVELCLSSGVLVPAWCAAGARVCAGVTAHVIIVIIVTCLLDC